MPALEAGKFWPADVNVILIDNFFTKEESDYYYHALLNDTDWREYEMPIYDKVVKAPRMISWFEDKTNIGGDSATP